MNKQWLFKLLSIGMIASVIMNTWAYEWLFAFVAQFHELMFSVYVTGVGIAMLTLLFRKTRIAFPFICIPLALFPAIVAGTCINFLMTTEAPISLDENSIATLGWTVAFIFCAILCAIGENFLHKTGK